MQGLRFRVSLELPKPIFGRAPVDYILWFVNKTTKTGFW